MLKYISRCSPSFAYLRGSLCLVYKVVKLLNDQMASFDWLRAEDLPEIMVVLNSVIREGKYLFCSEIKDMEEELEWFEHGQEQGMRYLVARISGRIVGGGSIIPKSFKSSHVVELGIFVEKACRNLGLGTALIKALVDIAKKDGFEIIQLSVYANNSRAFHVYRKVGFKEVGRLTDDVKFSDGTYSDRILMELLLTTDSSM